ncbi:hypothetical protein GWI33_020620 [Rhynchophorus ferrugineus]|uniref:Uncharacterized protein n=1 Tax=Rhynchophorus ferrugineus TaxID=354439 RepID=A0A834M364_RHYFE|nr:hypothetical protein GWI33_020620 [Rhynchophorus ferrugineus]
MRLGERAAYRPQSVNDAVTIASPTSTGHLLDFRFRFFSASVWCTRKPPHVRRPSDRPPRTIIRPMRPAVLPLLLLPLFLEVAGCRAAPSLNVSDADGPGPPPLTSCPLADGVDDDGDSVKLEISHELFETDVLVPDVKYQGNI